VQAASKPPAPTSGTSILGRLGLAGRTTSSEWASSGRAAAAPSRTRVVSVHGEGPAAGPAGVSADASGGEAAGPAELSRLGSLLGASVVVAGAGAGAGVLRVFSFCFCVDLSLSLSLSFLV
jgi:hypothetical protein